MPHQHRPDCCTTALCLAIGGRLRAHQQACLDRGRTRPVDADFLRIVDPALFQSSDSVSLDRRIEQATMSYGYGVSVSLFQIARAYTVLARDGQLLPVTIFKNDDEPVYGP